MHARPVPHTRHSQANPFLHKSTTRATPAYRKLDRGIRPICRVPSLGVRPVFGICARKIPSLSIAIFNNRFSRKALIACAKPKTEQEGMKEDLGRLKEVQDEQLDACLRLSASLQIKTLDIKRKALNTLQNQPNIGLQIAAITNLSEGDERDSALNKIIYRDTIRISYRIDAANNLRNAQTRENVLKQFFTNDKLDANERLKAASYIVISKDLEPTVKDLLLARKGCSRLDLNILKNLQEQNSRDKMALAFIQKGLASLLEAQGEDAENPSVEHIYELLLECIEQCLSSPLMQEQAALNVCKYVDLSKDFLIQVAAYIQDETLKQEVLQCIELGLKAIPGSKTKSAAKVYLPEA
jgi:hypothetical protein